MTIKEIEQWREEEQAHFYLLSLSQHLHIWFIWQSLNRRWNKFNIMPYSSFWLNFSQSTNPNIKVPICLSIYKFKKIFFSFTFVSWNYIFSEKFCRLKVKRLMQINRPKVSNSMVMKNKHWLGVTIRYHLLMYKCNICINYYYYHFDIWIDIWYTASNKTHIYTH